MIGKFRIWLNKLTFKQNDSPKKKEPKPILLAEICKTLVAIPIDNKIKCLIQIPFRSNYYKKRSSSSFVYQ